MGVGESHFELVSVCHSSEHVFDLRADCGYDAFLLLGTKPFVENDLGAFSLGNLFLDINWDMLEGFFQRAKWTFHFHNFVLYGNGDWVKKEVNGFREYLMLQRSRCISLRILIFFINSKKDIVLPYSLFLMEFS